MSEPELVEIAALSVEELRAALVCQRALVVQLQTVVDTLAGRHQTELAARGMLVAELRSQVAVLADKGGAVGAPGRSGLVELQPAAKFRQALHQAAARVPGPVVAGPVGPQARQAAGRAGRDPVPGGRP